MKHLWIVTGYCPLFGRVSDCIWARSASKAAREYYLRHHIQPTSVSYEH